jgi:PAS domain S-box-containing protein
MSQEILSIEKSLSRNQAASDEGIKLARLLFHSSPSPMLFLDESAGVMAANISFCSEFGWQQEDFQGRNFKDLLHADYRDDFESLCTALKRDEQYWIGEFVLQDACGDWYNTELAVQRIELQMQKVMLVCKRGGEKVNQPGKEKKAEAIKPDSMTEVLKSFMSSLDDNQNRFKEDLAHRISVRLLPTLEKMSSEASPQIRRSYREVLSKELQDLADGNGDGYKPDRDLLKLTPTEMEICQYIQSGRSSKEIADMMHSSFETIQTHRKNIRKKMGLKGRKTPLCTYLRVEKRLPRA